MEHPSPDQTWHSTEYTDHTNCSLDAGQNEKSWTARASPSQTVPSLNSGYNQASGTKSPSQMVRSLGSDHYQTCGSDESTDTFHSANSEQNQTWHSIESIADVTKQAPHSLETEQKPTGHTFLDQTAYLLVTGHNQTCNSVESTDTFRTANSEYHQTWLSVDSAGDMLDQTANSLDCEQIPTWNSTDSNGDMPEQITVPLPDSGQREVLRRSEKKVDAEDKSVVNNSDDQNKNSEQSCNGHVVSDGLEKHFSDGKVRHQNVDSPTPKCVKVKHISQSESESVTCNCPDQSDLVLDSEGERIPDTEVKSGSLSLRKLSRKQKFILASFCMVDFANFLCLSLIAPFFPQEAHSKGVNDTISGWIFAAFPLTQFLFAPVFGKLIPMVGLKFMYLSGTFISGACTLLFGFMTYVPVDNGNFVYILLCFLIRFFLALGCCANQTASFCLCAHEFPDNVGTIFGIGEVFVGLGFMSGPAIGGVLYGMGGFLVPFAVIGGLILLTTVFNYWIVPKDGFVPEPSSDGASLFALMRSYDTIINCVAITIAAMLWAVLDPTLEPHLEQFNLSPEMIGLLFLLMSAVYAISSPFWGWISDKMTDSRCILVVGLLSASGGMLLLGPSQILGFTKDDNQLWLNVISLIILGIADSAALIPTFDLLFRIAEQKGFKTDIHTYSLIAGLWGSMYALGDFLGPAIGGTLLDQIGFQALTTYTALVTGVMAAVLILTILCETKWCRCATALTDEERPLLTDNGDNRSNIKSYVGDRNPLASYPPHQTLTDTL